MTNKELIEQLNEHEYEAEEKVVTKNGVEMTGVVVKVGATCPVLYAVNYNTIEDALKDINETPSLEAILSDGEYILSNTFIALANKLPYNAIEFPCNLNGCKAYLCCNAKVGHFAVQRGLIEALGISEYEITERAIEKTIDDFVFKNFREMCYVTNKENVKGSGAIVLPCIVEEVKKKIGSDKIIVVPSSIHEVIVIDFYDYTHPIEELNEYVKEVNKTLVAPTEILADVVTIL